MKNMKTINAFSIGRVFKRGSFLLLGLLHLLVLSCNKQSLSPEDRLSDDLSKAPNSYVESGTGIFLNGTAYSAQTDNYIGLPVGLVSNTSAGDSIFATVDTTLIATYNKLYGETNDLYPKKSFTVSHNGAFYVSPQSSYSKDSLYVLLNDANNLQNGKTYLVPVTLSARSGSQLKYKVVFFKMTINKKDIVAGIYGGSTYSYYAPYKISNALLFTYYLSRDASGVPIAPDVLKMNVSLNAVFAAKDLYISGVPDKSDSLVKAYSALRGWAFQPFPDSTFQMVHDQVTIPKGALYSSDSLSVHIMNLKKFQTSTYYVLGIRLRKLPDPLTGVPAATDGSEVAYISFYIF